MIKSLKKIFFSIESAIFLFFIFAVSSAIATFIESSYGTETAWGVVYGTFWFGLIQFLLGVNLVYNIIRYKLYRKEKLPIFIFHVGFLFILLGAIITRYIGYEGLMHIRDGMTEDKIISSAPYVQIKAKKNGKIYYADKKIYLSKIGDNNFDIKMNVDGKNAYIKYIKYIPNAINSIVDDPNGEPMVSLMTTDMYHSSFVLKNGDQKKIDNIIFTLNKPISSSSKFVVNLITKNGKFYISSNQNIIALNMINQNKKTILAKKENNFTKKNLYSVGKIKFAPKIISLKGKEKLISEPNVKNSLNPIGLNALVVQIEYNGKTKKATMFGRGEDSKGFVKKVVLGGVPFSLQWGSKMLKLPFYVKLRHFQLDRYPGSMAPSSYSSEVTLIDKKNGVVMPFKIYMNHILKYKNYRFYQSSYDMDEKGTVLSVNHDPGIYPTYFGYLLLAIGFILTILSPKSRFRTLGRKIQQEIKKDKSIVISFLGAFVLLSISQPAHAVSSIKQLSVQQSINIVKKYNKAHADKFGMLLLQDRGGRVEPIDSFANEVMNKVARKRSFFGLDADQIVLGMLSSPEIWQNIPIIKVSDVRLKKILGIPKDANYASFDDFFKSEGNHSYKLSTYADISSRKAPIERNRFDRDILKADERVSVLYSLYTGELFKIFPKIDDPNNKWYSPKEAIATFPKNQSEEVRIMLMMYFDALQKGIKTGNWMDANRALKVISNYQQKYGKNILENKNHIKAEILYNHLNIFPRLIPVYLIAGFLLLLVIIYKLLKPKSSVELMVKLLFYILLLAFIAQTFNMGLRGYISGHAPWSDGYESMIYVAWSLIFAGLIFSKYSTMALSLTAILTGIFLFVANLSWMDPQITNLVPVLKSYWLMVHVSVITASYGFLGLNAILGFFTLIMFIMLSNDPKKSAMNQHIQKSITEASRVNEMSMILGLMMLTLGTFLGGVWANESWGRYWSWDPKETWALISILVYASVVHMRLIPKLNSQFKFAVASTVAYASVIMTYLGVNYYLVGMHSYATGQPVPIPQWVYWTIAIVSMVIIIAFPKRKHSKRL